MSTLSKIEFAGRTFYYDSRGHQLVTTGTIEKGDLLLIENGDTLRCYPAFWDDIGRPLSEFPLGALRPIKSPVPEYQPTMGEQFINLIDSCAPKNNQLAGTLAIIMFLALLVIITGLILFA
jgi:hypothetical protein